MEFDISKYRHAGVNDEGKRIVEYYKRGDENVVIVEDSSGVYSILEGYDLRTGSSKRERSFSDSLEKCREQIALSKDTVAFTEEVKEMGKQIAENLTSSPYKGIIGKYFDYTYDFEFLDIVADIIDRIDDFSDEQEAFDAIDAQLIYAEDQWKVMQFYQSPSEADFNSAMDSLTEDILGICNKIVESSDEEN